MSALNSSCKAITILSIHSAAALAATQLSVRRGMAAGSGTCSEEDPRSCGTSGPGPGRSRVHATLLVLPSLAKFPQNS